MTAILAALAGFGQASAPPASVSISDQNIFDAQVGTATAAYSIASDGNVKDGGGTTLEAWLNGTGGAVANYEVRATVVSGTLTSGTTGSWLSCSTTRTWSKVNSAQDNSTVTTVLTIEIRLASSGVVQDSATITLSAESDNNN